MLSAYRATGADLPFGDPLRPHGVTMEGWFWRITQPATGSVVIALAGVSRRRDGRAWGTVGLAAHPDGTVSSVAVDAAVAGAGDGAVVIGDSLCASGERLRVDLGAQAQLDISFDGLQRWPRRAFGGLGPAQSVPGLSQYWHPWLLAGRVRGAARIGNATVDLDGAVLYAEKNWSNAGFPSTWWWGHAHGFSQDERACVAFAGGRAGLGRMRMAATSLVVSAAGRHVHLVRAGRLGGALRVEMGESGWRLSGRTPTGIAVRVEGRPGAAAPVVLPVPLPAEGRNRPDAVSQHLAGELAVMLRHRGRTLFSGTSMLAGLEHGRLRPLSALEPAAPPAPGPRRR